MRHLGDHQQDRPQAGGQHPHSPISTAGSSRTACPYSAQSGPNWGQEKKRLLSRQPKCNSKVNSIFCDINLYSTSMLYSSDAVHFMNYFGPDCNELADYVIEAHLGALRHRRGYVWTLCLVFQAGIHCGIAPRHGGAYRHIYLEISGFWHSVATSNSTSSDLWSNFPATWLNGPL